MQTGAVINAEQVLVRFGEMEIRVRGGGKTEEEENP